MHAVTAETTSPLRYCLKPQEISVPATRSYDVGLVQRIQAGDQAAFRELVERYQSKVFRVIHRIMHNRQDAEEIAQDVFAKVYFSIKSFNCRSSLFTWLYRIAVNECYGCLRRKQVKLIRSGESTGEDRAIDLQAAADGRPDAGRVLIERDFVNKLLARIPEEDRNLLIWKEVEGFSVAQLTAMTGLNQSTVKVKLFRARRKLASIATHLSLRPIVPVSLRH